MRTRTSSASLFPHRPRGARRSRGRRGGERGLALAMALFALATLVLSSAAALSVGRAGILATRNYRDASRATFAAESGIMEAVQRINLTGIINFQTDVVNNWSALWGSGTHAFAPLSGFGYSVTATGTANGGRLVSTATGPDGVQSRVVATIVRENVPQTAPGAIYLASDSSTAANFKGGNFEVNGNDHNYTGGYGPASMVPGIATRTAANTASTIAALSDPQKDNVKGLGYLAGSPAVPSVITSAGALTPTQLDEIFDKLKNLPGVYHEPEKTFQHKKSIGYGTAEDPQITYFSDKAGVVIKGTGNIDGYGIMLVEGYLHIMGNFDFRGLVIVRGETVVKKDDTAVTGSATVYGSIWTKSLNLTIGGNVIVYYSSQALALAYEVGGSDFPTPVQITSLAHCGQLTAGTDGCP